MKKGLITTLLLLLSSILISCEQENNTIPLILYNEKDPYILQFKIDIMDNAQDKLDIKPYDSLNSQLIQNEIIGDILEENPKVIIVNPVDRLGAYTIIDKVKLQDIPIIFINREPLKVDMNSWSKLYYIGAPAENSAVIQSEMIIELFGDPNNLSELDKNNDGMIQLVLFKGEQGHQDAEIRTEVVLQELENYGYDLDIISIEVCDWQRNIAYNKMNELLKNIEADIELVISNNDAMAIGTIDAMIEHELFVDINANDIIEPGIDTWVPVVGIDGIDDAKIYFDNGYLYGTVLNDSEGMSLALVELVEALLNGDLDNLSFELEDGKYIWIDYQRYEKED